MAVDGQDLVYLLGGGVQVYQSDGTFVRAWNSQGGHHIKIDPEGNLWIADNGKKSHVVSKYSPEGKLILKDYVSAEDTYKEFKPTTFDSYSFDK